MTQTQRFDDLERFDEVDRTGQEAKFMAFLAKVDELPDVRARRHATYSLLGLEPGMTVVDVGCGIGTAAIEMAGRVSPRGKAKGIDLSEAMIAEARRRAAASGSAVEFTAGSALALPLPAAAVDGYRAERLYQHLADIPAALAEAKRVLRPGGKIVLVDQDWECAFLDADDVNAGREIHRAFTDSLVQGCVGRQFHRMLRRAGFDDVKVHADTVTSTAPGEYGFVVEIVGSSARAHGVQGERVDAWLADQRRRMEAGEFFLAMTHFIACATRPS